MKYGNYAILITLALLAGPARGDDAEADLANRMKGAIEGVVNAAVEQTKVPTYSVERTPQFVAPGFPPVTRAKLKTGEELRPVPGAAEKFSNKIGEVAGQALPTGKTFSQVIRDKETEWQRDGVAPRLKPGQLADALTAAAVPPPADGGSSPVPHKDDVSPTDVTPTAGDGDTRIMKAVLSASGDLVKQYQKQPDQQKDQLTMVQDEVDKTNAQADAQKDMIRQQQMQQMMAGRGGQGAGSPSGSGSGSGSGSDHPADAGKTPDIKAPGNPLDGIFGNNGKEPDASSAFANNADAGANSPNPGAGDLNSVVNPSTVSSGASNANPSSPSGAFNPPNLSLPFGKANTPGALAFSDVSRGLASEPGGGGANGVPKVGGNPGGGSSATAGDAYPGTGQVKYPPSAPENFEQANVFGGGGGDGAAVAAAGGGEGDGDGASKDKEDSFTSGGLERQLASSREETPATEPGIFRYRGIVCSEELKHTVSVCGHLKHHRKPDPGITAQKSFREPKV